MTNYLDTATNTDAVLVADLGWELLTLFIDWIYSIFKFVIYFVTQNFAEILIIAVLMLIATLWLWKLFSKAKAKTKVV